MTLWFIVTIFVFDMRCVELFQSFLCASDTIVAHSLSAVAEFLVLHVINSTYDACTLAGR